MARNFGFTFGRTEEGRDRDYAELEKRLAQQGIPPIPPATPPDPTAGVGNPSVVGITPDWVHVPSNDLYFSREITLKNRDWYDTHKEIQKLPRIQLPDGATRVQLMPKPKETWELIFYLRDNLKQPGFREMYDSILKKTSQNTWHGEWQNAFYEQDNGKMYVKELTGFNPKNEPIFSPRREITEYLTSDGWADMTQITNITKEGLLKVPSNKTDYKQGENIYSYYPRNVAVAGFDAGSGRVYFGCIRGPTNCIDSLGVRLVAKKF